MHLLCWKKTCLSKKKGGLGITSIKHRNISLLAKWWWRNKKETNSLWQRILQSKYGDSELLSDRPVPRNRSPIMNSNLSVKSFPQLKLFSNIDFQWKAGNGETIKFWKDQWIGGEILKDKYPRIFYLSLHKNVSLKAMHLEWIKNRLVSSNSWSRTLRQ